MKESSKSKIIITVAGMAIMLCVGILYMWSVFLPYVTAHHGWEKSDVAMTASIMMATFVIGNIVGGVIKGKLSTKLICLIGSVLFSLGIFLTSLLGSSNPALIYVTYGVLSGLGCGIAYCGVLAVMQKWWASRIGFITGLSVCFFGLSVVVLSPVVKSLLGGSLGVPGTFRVLSLVFAVVTILCSLLMRDPSAEYLAAASAKAGSKGEVKSYKPGEVVRQSTYYYLLITMFTFNAAYMVINPYISSIGTDRGLSESAALIAVMCTGIANSLGRLLVPSLSDKLGRTRTMNLCAILSMASCLLMVFAKGGLYIVAVFLIAFAYGGGSGINPVISTELYGPRYSGTNYGLLLIGLAASSVVFGKITGIIDQNPNIDFSVIFIICAALCIIPIVMMLCLRRYCARSGKKI